MQGAGADREEVLLHFFLQTGPAQRVHRGGERVHPPLRHIVRGRFQHC